MDSGHETPAPISPAETTSPGVQVETGAETGGASAGSPAVQPVTPTLEGGGRYVVQVASLSSKENADRLESRLQKQGFSVSRDTVESDVGRLYRVRVGPFEKETEAAEASARIKTELTGVSPRVLDLQPDLTAPVTNPNDPLVRWVVQLGVFNDSGNAQKLVEQLRSEGMTAYSETISGKPVTTYRVRVGPFLEHEEATRTQQQLSERQKISGVVMTAD
jgi:cell division septation protein DedD